MSEPLVYLPWLQAFAASFASMMQGAFFLTCCVIAVVHYLRDHAPRVAQAPAPADDAAADADAAAAPPPPDVNAASVPATSWAPVLALAVLVVGVLLYSGLVASRQGGGGSVTEGSSTGSMAHHHHHHPPTGPELVFAKTIPVALATATGGKRQVRTYSRRGYMGMGHGNPSIPFVECQDVPSLLAVHEQVLGKKTYNKMVVATQLGGSSSSSTSQEPMDVPADPLRQTTESMCVRNNKTGMIVAPHIYDAEGRTPPAWELPGVPDWSAEDALVRHIFFTETGKRAYRVYQGTREHLQPMLVTEFDLLRAISHYYSDMRTGPETRWEVPNDPCICDAHLGIYGSGLFFRQVAPYPQPGWQDWTVMLHAEIIKNITACPRPQVITPTTTMGDDGGLTPEEVGEEEGGAFANNNNKSPLLGSCPLVEYNPHMPFPSKINARFGIREDFYYRCHYRRVRARAFEPAVQFGSAIGQAQVKELVKAHLADDDIGVAYVLGLERFWSETPPRGTGSGWAGHVETDLVDKDSYCLHHCLAMTARATAALEARQKHHP